MASRFFTASRIHDGLRFLPGGSSIELSEDGTIIGIHEDVPKQNVAHFDGVLTPGFINAHCHLELSHMHGLIPKGTGLIPFLQAVTQQRSGFTDEAKKAARHDAYAELLRNGVVAVGDIANTADTADLRTRGALHMHSFVECIGFTESGAAARLEYAADVMSQLAVHSSPGTQMRQSIVPHAPYSVSPTLFRLINAAEDDSLLSIHNQESFGEDEYFRSKTGPVRDLLGGFGIDDSFFSPSGKSSLQTYLPLLSQSHGLILVHNTCSNAEDVALAQSRCISPHWCLCPAANLYIEGRLPDVDMIRAATGNICIGTDSLASNERLSVFSELLMLKLHIPTLDWEELLRWGTLNGARALEMADMIGAFIPGLRPGVVHISSLDESGIVQRIC